jgi:hypothetical protein
MNANRSTGKMNAAALGIAAMALCFALGAWAQDPADVDDPVDLDDPADLVDVDDPADSTGVADVDDPADSTGLVDIDDPADSTGVADIGDPADSTGVADIDDPADSTDVADIDVPADSTDLADSGDTGDADGTPDAAVPVITITKQPAAAIVVAQGNIMDTLTITAGVTEGAALSYQWYEKSDSLDDNSIPYETEAVAIDGATSASFAIPADLDTGTYVYYCVVSAAGAASVRSDDAVVTVADPTSVASADREIPSPSVGGAAAVSPVTALSAEFAAGPNPVAKQSGGVSFFRGGKGIVNATLYVYNASGDVVRKISLNDNSAGGFGKRAVGAWDLRDSKGRLVPEGSYVVKGAILTKDGKKEKVSLILGVK